MLPNRACLLSAVALGLAGQTARPAAHAAPQPTAQQPAPKGQPAQQSAQQSAQPSTTQQAAQWQPLFDSKTLAGWQPTAFTGHGKVTIAEGAILLEPGQPMTGITSTAPLAAQTNYEIRYEAQRRRGNDFFATLTFPVGASFCTWIAGGWGGDIVGLSSLDGQNASENETRMYFTFENSRWYRMRLAVTPERIRAWIDGERVIDVSIQGREVGLRYGETKLMMPLGFAAYATAGAIRKIEWRRLD